MPHKVIYRPLARQDLVDLYRFIRRRRGETTVAAGYVRRIRAVIATLADFPERGTLRPDLGEGMRLFGFERRVTILFRVKGDQVEIGRILYAGRELPRSDHDDPF